MAVYQRHLLSVLDDFQTAFGLAGWKILPLQRDFDVHSFFHELKENREIRARAEAAIVKRKIQI